MEKSDCIVEGLYLGGIMAALNDKDLTDKEITHILSIDENPLPQILTQRFSYKHIYALDLYDTDLLSSFTDTFVFIEQAKNAGGNVLVHCQAGMSRSATVVASYLMQKMAIGRDKALELIKNGRPFVRPNDGFMDQLDLFESMGCQLIKTHKSYRAFKLSKLADKFHSGHIAEGSPECEIPSELLINSDFASGANDAYYKCRKCRIILFRHGAVTTHAMGIGESAFDWRGQGPAKHALANTGGGCDQETCTRSLFVDPLQWMKGKINTVAGKLHCPKCDIKLGSFVWYGEKCPCGAWVAPAFHIDLGKIDRIPFHTVAPQVHNAAGATTSPTSTPSLGRPLSSFSDFAHKRPLSQGPNFSAGHLGASRSSTGKPTVMVAAVAPRIVAQDGPSTSSALSPTGMEIDELSLAVGTSSLEITAPSELGDVRSAESNVCMDVDS